MNSYEIARMLSMPNNSSDTLSAKFGTVSAVHNDGTASVILDGATTAQRLPLLSAPSAGSRSVVIQEGTNWFIPSLAGLGVRQASKTITCTVAGLQGVINELPKFLSCPITINVTAGTVTSDIVIEDFFGTGSLIIYCVDSTGATIASPNVQTHKCNRVVIQNCTLSRCISVTGMTATATSTSCFQVYRCSTPRVSLLHCNAVAGSKDSSENRGVLVQQSSSEVYVGTCTFSNKYQAVNVQYAKVVCNDLSGAGNGSSYRAQSGGSIYMLALGTIAGDSKYSHATGGLIHHSNSVGMVNRSSGSNPNSDWVWRQWGNGVIECWRNSSASVTITTAWPGGGYRTASPVGNYAFPFTFTDVPAVTRHVAVASGSSRTLSYSSVGAATTTNTGDIYVVDTRSGSADSASVSIRHNIHAIGRAAL